MSPPNFVGYDDDPLPPEPFRASFGPPRSTLQRSKPERTTPPRSGPQRPLRLLKPKREERNSDAPLDSGWHAAPAPVTPLPHASAAPVYIAPVAAGPSLGEHLLTFAVSVPVRMTVLAAAVMAPMACLAGWLGLPGSAPEFLMTAPGLLAWQLFGGADALMLYYVLVFGLSLGALALRPARRPLAALAGAYWGWTLVHLAGKASMLPFTLPALPLF
jgi:hypothetical protein